MGNKRNFDLKVAILVELERHRDEMETIYWAAVELGQNKDQITAAMLEVILEIGGVCLIKQPESQSRTVN